MIKNFQEYAITQLWILKFTKAIDARKAADNQDPLYLVETAALESQLRDLEDESKAWEKDNP